VPQEIAGVAFERTYTGFHVGIIHKSDSSNHKFLHLAWHLQLENDDLNVPYRVFVNIPEARARQVAAYCRLVWERNAHDGIPYAFSAPNDAFDPESASFLLSSTRVGLTCASFVLAVFHAVGLRLADYSTWLPRESDTAWQTEVISYMVKSGADPRHIESVTKEVGSIRFRPAEVVAAAEVFPPSASFEQAAERARNIENEV
jgi:hypothetical protein